MLSQTRSPRLSPTRSGWSIILATRGHIPSAQIWLLIFVSMLMRVLVCRLLIMSLVWLWNQRNDGFSEGVEKYSFFNNLGECVSNWYSFFLKSLVEFTMSPFSLWEGF